jgi:arginine/lysine/ornithine decarboxylase
VQGRDALAAVQESIRRAAEAGEMDQERAPMLEALEAYHAIETVSFSIPAHKGGGAIDEATRSVLGIDPYRADAPAHKGLDDRVSTYQVLSYAQDLAADALAPTRRCSPPTARR